MQYDEVLWLRRVHLVLGRHGWRPRALYQYGLKSNKRFCGGPFTAVRGVGDEAYFCVGGQFLVLRDGRDVVSIKAGSKLLLAFETLAKEIVTGTTGCAAAMGGASGRARSSSRSGVVLTVSTVDDVVNGDVSSPAALLADPGRDGISLREAVLAADHGSGPTGITFARALAGRTIMPTPILHLSCGLENNGDFPAITRDQTTIVGLTRADGEPAVTVDWSKLKGFPGSPQFRVQASDVSIMHLRVAGTISVELVPGGERRVHDVRIESNVLDDGGVSPGRNAIGIGPEPDPRGFGVTGVLSQVTVADNTIRNFSGDGICVCVGATRSSVDGLLIEGNTFSHLTGTNTNAVELSAGRLGNSIVGTRVVGNSFVDDFQGVGFFAGLGVTEFASGDTVRDTVISQNVFQDGQEAAIVIGGGAGNKATGNAVRDVEISNDVFTGTHAEAIAVFDDVPPSPAGGNRVDGVGIVNDTIAFNTGGLSLDKLESNGIANVSIVNTLFWMNNAAGDIAGNDAAAAQESSSLTGVDPRFVSAQDVHLQADSPAINAGTTTAAPAVDLEGRLRDDQPDIGAYEYGAALRPQLDVSVDELGGSGAVTSSPAGIACERACTAGFTESTPVTLTAVPAKGSRFAGWAGACSGTKPCTLTLAADVTVTATFAPARG